MAERDRYRGIRIEDLARLAEKLSEKLRKSEKFFVLDFQLKIYYDILDSQITLF